MYSTTKIWILSNDDSHEMDYDLLEAFHSLEDAEKVRDIWQEHIKGYLHIIEVPILRGQNGS